MQEDIKAYIRNCSISQQAKVDQALPYGLLQPFPIPQQIWEDVDLLASVPKINYSIIILSKSVKSTRNRFN